MLYFSCHRYCVSALSSFRESERHLDIFAARVSRKASIIVKVNTHDLPQGGTQDRPGRSFKNIVNFFFEAGMLKKTPRSGYQFLGSGKESVADHSFRMTLIGFTLARLTPGADPFKVVRLCLFHDLPEARTGDMNYVNKQYVKVNERGAVADLAETLPFGEEVSELLEEYRKGQTLEAKLTHDADVLDLILELKEQNDLGNSYARKWIEFALNRLQTDIGKDLAAETLRTDSAAWWFEGHDHWWHRNQEE
jgi:putative hydrolase of HD superfamily